METKMKDNEIIKALELCMQVDSDICDICPLYDEENGCLEIDLRKPALELINRQKAEIERLQKLLGYAENCIDEFEYAYYRVGDSNSRIDDALEEYNNLVKEMTEDYK